MKSKVYFTSAEVKEKSLLDKLSELIMSLPMEDTIETGARVAVKVHMGGKGCTRYLRPIFIREIVDLLRKLKSEPFVTDTTTLYPGNRWSVAECYENARLNGFVEDVLGCPVIIADHPKFRSKMLPTKSRKVREVEVAGAIAGADCLVVVSHAKGHDLCGFGGAIKNLGMGCLTKRGKTQVHDVTKPNLVKSDCVGCGDCVEACPWKAIKIQEEKAFIDQDKCTGCTSCTFSCSQRALYIPFRGKIEFQRLLAGAASGIAEHFVDRIFYVNFILDVTPLCDCAPFSNIPVVPDIGILASTDIVATDKASLDLIDQERVYPNSVLDGQNIETGRSKFQNLHGINPFIQVSTAEELGIGSTQFVLVKIDDAHAPSRETSRFLQGDSRIQSTTSQKD